MTTHPLIAIIGRKRVGKDSFAAPLVEHFGYSRVAFADPLKEAALKLDPLVGPCSLPGDLVPSYRRLSEVVAALGWEKAKDTVPGARSTLQKLGQAIRLLDPGFWLDRGMEQASSVDGAVVFTDCRFPNEADAVRAAGGLIVRITRDGVDDGDLDESETALDDYRADLNVPNNGTLAQLQDLATSIARDYDWIADRAK